MKVEKFLEKNQYKIHELPLYLLEKDVYKSELHAIHECGSDISIMENEIAVYPIVKWQLDIVTQSERIVFISRGLEKDEFDYFGIEPCNEMKTE